jgi:hypothetical protein
MFRLMQTLCSEARVRDSLWNDFLLDRLIACYQEAMDYTRFLLHMERGIMPSTFNHYYNTNLQHKRAERVFKPLKGQSVSFKGYEGAYVPLDRVEKCVIDKSNEQQACDDIMDSLISYYKVARKRFVDVVCQQAVLHYLLISSHGPLSLLSPELIMLLDTEELEAIAGEDADSRQIRISMEREIRSLEAALKVLRDPKD